MLDRRLTQIQLKTSTTSFLELCSTHTVHRYRVPQKNNSIIELPAQVFDIRFESLFAELGVQFIKCPNLLQSWPQQPVLVVHVTHLHSGCFLVLHSNESQYWVLMYNTNSRLKSDFIASFRLFPLLTARLQSSEVVTAVQSSSVLVRLCYLVLLALTCCQGDQVLSLYWVPTMEPCYVWQMHQTQLHTGKL